MSKIKTTSFRRSENKASLAYAVGEYLDDQTDVIDWDVNYSTVYRTNSNTVEHFALVVVEHE